MAQFFWKQHVEEGRMCIACMSQQNDRGFVDFISEVNVYRSAEDRVVVGVVDGYFCAQCLEQMASMVGSTSVAQTQVIIDDNIKLERENQKLKEEVGAWQQRIFQLASLDLEDFHNLEKLRKAGEVSEPPTDPPTDG